MREGGVGEVWATVDSNLQERAAGGIFFDLQSKKCRKTATVAVTRKLWLVCARRCEAYIRHTPKNSSMSGASRCRCGELFWKSAIHHPTMEGLFFNVNSGYVDILWDLSCEAAS